MCFIDHRERIRRSGSIDEIVDYFYEHAGELAALAGLWHATAEFAISEFTDHGDAWSFIIWWVGDADWAIVLEQLGFTVNWKWVAPVPQHGADAHVEFSKADWPVMAIME